MWIAFGLRPAGTGRNQMMIPTAIGTIQRQSWTPEVAEAFGMIVSPL